jgi:hypothetical protein
LPSPPSQAPPEGAAPRVVPPARESAPPPDVTPPAPPAAPAPRPAPPPEPAASANPPAAPKPEPAERHDAPAGPARSGEVDDAAIRRVVATYARAIETKDLALYRSVKPNLSPDEQRRIEEGFRAVTSQQVNITIVSIEQRAQDASVRLRRRDTIQAGGRQQTSESLQTMTLVRSASGWVIREIGR